MKFMLPLACAMLLECAHATPIEIMVEDAATPMSNADGSGYANDLVRAAFAAAQYEVRLTVVPYARCKQSVMRGDVAACFSMSRAPEFDNVVSFADKPLYSVYPKYFYNVARPLNIDSEQQFKPGTRVGIVNGYEYPEAVTRLTQRGVIFERTRSEINSLKMLSLGRFDAVLIMGDDIKTDAALTQRAGLHNLAVAFRSTPMGSFIGFSTSHADGTRARLKFNEGYELIARNGTKAAIDRKWRLKAGCAAAVGNAGS